ncbi:MAG: mannose-1-phosphate guanylyltransferase/mannose-6-phosphate isomerase [Desulfovibrio sp.]|jgi:mannose-1-phosphate guanylyltransferase/mannose-1-phosphate guanylyltransferase/mannose-6-phosphate isomerase|nr:mannose-1-phosphate guanylyltransferase/mannose-6-phosphate isomerase [Desulfovibrio sp.]
MKLCPVVLCGGSGTRLWPLSRSLYPKQFMDLGGYSLFGNTLRRIQALPSALPPVVVCNEEQRFLAAAQLQDAGFAAADIILEPVGRNTAPAIAAAALAVVDAFAAPPSGGERRDALSSGDAPLLLVLPSDHALRDANAFAGAVGRAARLAAGGRLVAFGVEPDSPETGYGWIEPGEALQEGYAVRRFVEKPRLEDARAMLTRGGHYWNSGMFLFAPRVYLEELERHAPLICEHARKAFAGRRRDADFTRLEARAFTACPSDSIDYAVMEQTDLSAVMPLNAAWSDMGTWESVYAGADKDMEGNALMGDVIAEAVENSYLHSSGRLVAALGVSDLVVVETGDAVLVADKKRSREIKGIVERLARAGRVEKDTHLRVFRPWGWYETLARGDRFQVKRIMVNPGATLSLQMHHHRAEHWVVVRGTGHVTVGEKTILLHEDQSTYIPLGQKHRLGNPGKLPLEIIEVQSGPYLGEDDIVRYEDDYGRDAPRTPLVSRNPPAGNQGADTPADFCPNPPSSGPEPPANAARKRRCGWSCAPPEKRPTSRRP